MPVWNSREVERAVYYEKLSGWQKAKYYIFSTACFGSISFSELFGAVSKDNLPFYFKYWNTVSMLLMILIVYTGTKMCYRVNEKMDSKNFVERIVCLGIPAGIRAILIGVLFYLVLIVVIVRSGYPGLTLVAYVGLAMAPLVQSVFFGLLYRSFKRLMGLFTDELRKHESGSV
jgi:Na+-driven multidrug efflux pump